MLLKLQPLEEILRTVLFLPIFQEKCFHLRIILSDIPKDSVEIFLIDTGQLCKKTVIFPVVAIFPKEDSQPDLLQQFI